MAPSFAETTSLRIRGYLESDQDKLIVLLNDPKSSRSGPGFSLPQSESAMKKTVEEMTGCLMLCIIEAKTPLADGNNWVGVMQLMKSGTPKNRAAMFGICLDERFWGNGYATEATHWIVDHAFKQLALHRVVLGTSEDNVQAIKVYKKVGFVEEGRARRSNFQDGKWWDYITMAILEDEWQ